MLRQAFLNLALNACQAMPNGGTLRIRVRVGARPPRRDRRSATPASASSPSTCSGSSICTSRRRRRAAASACRWSTGRCRCTTARSRYSRRQGRARRSACCCRRRERCDEMHLHAAVGSCPPCCSCRGCCACRCRRLHARAGEDDARRAAARHAGAAAARRRADRSRGAAAGAAAGRAGAQRAAARRVRAARRGAATAEPPKTEPPKPNRRRPSRRSRPRSRRSRRRTLQTTPATAEGEVERAIRATLHARDRRPQPRRLPRAQRRRANAVRHREALHPAGGRRDRATKNLVVREERSRTKRPRSQLSSRTLAATRSAFAARDVQLRRQPVGIHMHRRQHLASDLKEKHNMWCLHA